MFYKVYVRIYIYIYTGYVYTLEYMTDNIINIILEFCRE